MKKKHFNEAHRFWIASLGFITGVAFSDFIPLWLSIVIGVCATMYMFYVVYNLESGTRIEE